MTRDGLRCEEESVGLDGEVNVHGVSESKNGAGRQEWTNAVNFDDA